MISWHIEALTYLFYSFGLHISDNDIFGILALFIEKYLFLFGITCVVIEIPFGNFELCFIFTFLRNIYLNIQM